jgi:hypothetical protein
MTDDLFRGDHPEPDEPGAVLYQHTVLAQTCLPYRDPGLDVRVWERANGSIRLRVEAGSALHPETGEWVQLGLPHGPKPRLILAHLNAMALRTGSPEIEVEASLTAFVKRLGLDPKGRNMRIVKDQLARLATAQVRLAVAYSEREARQVQAHLIGEFDLWLPKESGGRVLWPTTVTLDPRYFISLTKHAVPLHEHALAALAHNAMALDAYTWTAQRLHRVPVGQPQLVPWAALRAQFGWHYERTRDFRRDFLSTLRLVLDQYPSAKLEADERGLLLRWSPPPVLCRRSTVPRMPEPEPPADGGEPSAQAE